MSRLTRFKLARFIRVPRHILVIVNSPSSFQVGINRRQFLRRTASATSLLALSPKLVNRTMAAEDNWSKDASSYLQSVAPTDFRFRQFTEIMSPEESVTKSNGWTYHSQLGWVHCPAMHQNGVDNSKTFYSYESDGARRVIHFTDRPCRLHAYGNSFTHCDQVNDSETWEEYLAAHLQEPIRNYGVGGFSVYQAYRRMLATEPQRSAKYIILNIYEDDHYRNLDAWRSIRVGAGSNCGFTLPHLKVNMAANTCEEVENLLPERSSVGKLRSGNYRDSTFAEDPILRIKMALQSDRPISESQVREIAASFGFPENEIPDTAPKNQIRKIHTEAALFATSKIIERTDDYVRKHDKKLMLILSFGRGRMKEALSGKALFDQTLVDKLASKTYPVIDMRPAFASAYASFKGNLETFLAPYYIGHHTPRGNFFTAWAIKNEVANWLSPKPAPYQE